MTPTHFNEDPDAPTEHHGIQRNDRIRQIFDRMVEDARVAVADLGITEEELLAAGRFFNTMGKEDNFYTLLFATLSTASDETLYRSKGVSHSNVVGPVYKKNPPHRPDGNLLDHSTGEGSTPFVVSGRVYDVSTGEPVAGAELDVWQADQDGNYDNAGYNMRGIVPTDAEGRYRITTVLPADYESHWNDTITDLWALIGRGTLRAAHVHIKVSLNGEHLLTTQIFRSDSTRLDDDLIIGIVKPELIGTVVPSPEGSGEPWTMEFDIPVNTHQHAPAAV